MAKIFIVIISIFSFLFFLPNPSYAQSPTFGPTCVATVGPGTPTPLPTFGPTCGATLAPTSTNAPTATPRPTATPIPHTPTPTPPVSGNPMLTLMFLGIAASLIFTGLTTLYSTRKAS